MPEYRSRERVYNLDADGEPYSLRYAVGDVIPVEEARRQGLLDEPASKRQATPPADKARRTPPADKTRS